jgi:hypothetical protein
MPMLEEGTIDVTRDENCQSQITISASNDKLFNYIYHKFTHIAPDISEKRTAKTTTLVSFDKICVENGGLKKLADSIAQDRDNTDISEAVRVEAVKKLYEFKLTP